MDTTRTKKQNRLSILMYLYMILVLLVLLVTATYTWFSLSRTPRVSDLYMFVNAKAGLELSLTPDAEEWEMQLDFRDMVDETAPLRPVTWSDKDQCFYAANYGPDGRMTDQWEPLTDSRHANKDNIDGYYVKATFYARSGQPVAVSLSPAVEVNEGLQGSGTYLIGYPIWDNEEIVHFNGGMGGQNAVRLGFRITPVNSSGASTGAGSDFYIYEPNIKLRTGDPAETESDVSEVEPDSNETAEEPDSDTTEEETQPSKPAKSVLADRVPGYVPTPSIDGTADLVDENRMILQGGSFWTEANPVQREAVIHSLGEFMTDPYLFSLEEDEIVRIELYIWLEGQDVDCTNEIQKAQILASIQFATESENQSGMVPIPY